MSNDKLPELTSSNVCHFIYRKLFLSVARSHSPEFNLMEGVWKWLKETVIHNVFFGSVQKIVLAVRAFLRYASERAREVIDRLCVRL
jgi:transposase